MRTLVYKRTHEGDPSIDGRFGVWHCMGKVRSWEFQAIIGIGGIGVEAEGEGIAGKVNWIGIGPVKVGVDCCGNPILAFKRFKNFPIRESPELRDEAPALAKRFYAEYAPRFLLDDLSEREKLEIRKLRRLASDAKKSRFLWSRKTSKPSSCFCDKPGARCRARSSGC
jgi:hypothetical protein